MRENRKDFIGIPLGCLGVEPCTKAKSTPIDRVRIILDYSLHKDKILIYLYGIATGRDYSER
jgi:hypothetical protein